MAILNNGTLKNITEYPNTFKRQGAFPLEMYSVFYTMEAATTYASSNPIAYVGQNIVVVTDTSVEMYLIADTDGTLKKLASTSSSGDLAGDVATLQSKVATLEGKVTTLEGKAEHIVDIEQGDGIEITTVDGDIDIKTVAVKKDTTVSDNLVNVTTNGVSVVLPDITNDMLDSELQNTIANKADKATTLAGYGITDAYTKSETDTKFAEINGKLAGALHFRGVKDYYNEVIAIADAQVGDVWAVRYTGTSGTTPLNAEYVCTDVKDGVATWTELGSIIDLSGYATNESVNSSVTNLQNQITANDNDIANINNSINGINNSISNIGTDITNINGALASAVERIDDSLNNINSSITGMAQEYTNQFNDIDNSINTINSDLTNIHSDINTINEWTTNYSANMSNTINTINATHANDISTLNSSITNINNDVSNLTNRVGDIETNIANIEANIPTIATNAKAGLVKGAVDGAADNFIFVDSTSGLMHVEQIGANIINGVVDNASHAVSANKIDHDITISVTGEVIGNVTTNMSTNSISIATNLKTVGTEGTYTKVTTDAYGRVISATNITTADVGGAGDIITHNVSEFATSVQGEKADTAVQSVAGVNGPTITKDALKTATGFVEAGDSVTFTNTIAFSNGATSKATDSSSSDSTLTTKGYVDNEIKTKIAASDAMVYRGTVGTGGTVATLPTTGVINGDAYKVITDGVIADAKVGDFVIAVVTTGKDNSVSIDWTLIPSGNDGNVYVDDAALRKGELVIGASDRKIKSIIGLPGQVVKVMTDDHGNDIIGFDNLDDIAVESTDNSIKVNSYYENDCTTYQLEVQRVSTDTLVQGTNVLILDGGTSVA